MTLHTGMSAGEPPINFLAHQARLGEAGAREEFEQMLALLAQALHGEAHQVRARGNGDWGIDVLIGSLNGRVTIWQSKYFVNGVGKSQRRDIGDSFAAALEKSRDEGHEIGRWVLCIPCSMEPVELKWWSTWSAERHEATGIEIGLYAETQLRGLLLRPEAAHVARAFYHPYRDPDALSVPRLRVVPSDPDPHAWFAGAEIRFASNRYLLHDPVTETLGADGSWVWREATADQFETVRQRVRLRQLSLRRLTSDGAQRRDGVRAQADLLASLDGRNGLPRSLAVMEAGHEITLVSECPTAPSWREVFGPGAGGLDRLAAAAAFVAAAPLCAALAEIHKRGHAHRALSPDSIAVGDRHRRGLLRDLGLAGMPFTPGEGAAPYRAPEQERLATRGRRPGRHTDVFQLAALLYHTLTGYAPVWDGNPPVSAILPQFPADLDRLLTQALSANPSERPSIERLATALRSARRTLSQPGSTQTAERRP